MTTEDNDDIIECESCGQDCTEHHKTVGTDAMYSILCLECVKEIESR